LKILAGPSSNSITLAKFLLLGVSIAGLQGAGYVMLLLSSRFLSIEEFAVVRLADSWLVALAIPAALGIPTAVTRMAAERLWSTGDIFRSGVTVAGISSTVVAGVSAALFLALKGSESVEAIVLSIAMPSLVLATIGRVGLSIRQGRSEWTSIALASVISSVAGILITWILVARGGAKAWAVSRLIVECVTAGVLVIPLFLKAPGSSKKPVMSALCTFGLPVLGAMMLDRGLSRADLILLDYLGVPGGALGNYGAMSLVALLLVFPSGILGTLVYPEFVVASGTLPVFSRRLVKAAVLTALVSAGPCLTVAVFPSQTLSLMVGRKYVVDPVMMAILSGSALIQAVTSVLGGGLLALGRPRMNLIGNALGLLVMLGLGYTLVAAYGVLGCTFAMMGSQLARFVMYVASLRTALSRMRNGIPV
jgi:O-antigen/teichoic acid export membrane protein